MINDSNPKKPFFKGSSFKGRGRLITAAAFHTPYGLLITNFILTGYAISLGANDLQIGLLTTLPLIASLAQFPASALYEYTGHAKLSHILIGIPGMLIWFFILSIPVIYEPGHRVIPFLIALFIQALFMYASNPSWQIWLSNLIPKWARGRYLARQSIIVNIPSMLALFIIGRYLALYPKESFSGFQKVFFVAVIFRIITIVIHTSIPPGSESKPEKASTNYMGLLLQVLRNNKFMYFIALQAYWG